MSASTKRISSASLEGITRKTKMIVLKNRKMVLRRGGRILGPRGSTGTCMCRILGLSGKARQVRVRILSGEEHQEPDNHRIGNGQGHRGRTEILG